MIFKETEHINKTPNKTIINIHKIKTKPPPKAKNPKDIGNTPILIFFLNQNIHFF